MTGVQVGFTVIASIDAVSMWSVDMHMFDPQVLPPRVSKSTKKPSQSSNGTGMAT